MTIFDETDNISVEEVTNADCFDKFPVVKTSDAQWDEYIDLIDHKGYRATLEILKERFEKFPEKEREATKKIYKMMCKSGITYQMLLNYKVMCDMRWNIEFLGIK